MRVTTVEAAGSPTQPQPQAPNTNPGDTFSIYLTDAVSAYSRKQSQTMFLRSAGYPAQVAMERLIDEAQRLEVMRNASRGYQFAGAHSEQPLPKINASEMASAGAENNMTTMRASISSTQDGENVALAPGDLSLLSLADFPRPAGDNGRGVHWVPTLQSTPEVVDQFVDRAVDMGMKWVVILNDHSQIGQNDYLVKKLTANGIMPVIRVFTDGLEPVNGDLEAMVRHYRELGVSYFQLYNEPNLKVETHGQNPSVSKYLDLWIPAAKQVIAAGGLPGIGALSPQGEMDDRKFLQQMLDQLESRGEMELLNRTWLAVHNYTGPRTMEDPDGFLRYRQYDAIIRNKLGRSMAMVGTEGGTHVSQQVSEAEQVNMVTEAYQFMEETPDPYFFAYTYWIIANEAGGGKDSEFSHHALYTKDGPTSLANALTKMA